MHRKLLNFFAKITVIISCLTAAASFACTPPDFLEMITFGDGLTDVGNVAGVTEPGSAPVINGYYLDTHFSDNVIWVETLASYWNMPARTPGRGFSTSLPENRRGNTWAWGGSEAAYGTVEPDGVIEPIPNLVSEVHDFLANRNTDNFTLYAIWAGADNLLDGGKFSTDQAKKAVHAIERAIVDLDVAGAGYIMVFNLPRLGDLPGIQANGSEAVKQANAYTKTFNKYLKKKLHKLAHVGAFNATLYYVDIYTELKLVVDTVNRGHTYTPKFFVPGPAVAINNVTSQGLNYFNANGTYPSNYLFWDATHFSTLGHQLFAGLALSYLTPIGCHP